MSKDPKKLNSQSLLDNTYPNEKDGKVSTPLAVDLLPAVFRTDTNKKVFGAVVEDMFQPSAIENINYYVGRPSGSDKIKQESLPRKNSRRQLETGLIIDTESSTRLLTADDIALAQGFSDSHLAEPAVPVSVLDLPINPDKFVNWSNYYWLEQGMPTVYIVGTAITEADSINVETDILGKQHYTLPVQLNGKTLELKNGMRLVFLKEYPNRNTIDGNTSETHIADGTNQIDFYHEMTQQYDKALISIRVNGVLKTRLGGGPNPDYTFTNGSVIWLDGKVPTAGSTIEIDLPDFWVSTESTNTLSPDRRLVNRQWQVEGVGTASGIRLLPLTAQTTSTVYSSTVQSLWDQTTIPWDRIAWDGDVPGINDKHYVLQAPDATNRSAFSRVNVWVHKDTIQTVCDYLDISFGDIISKTSQALRPIVEFDRRLELYNHGVRYRAWVDAVVDRPTTLVPINPVNTGLDVFYGHTLTTLLVYTTFGNIENVSDGTDYLFDRIVTALDKAVNTDDVIRDQGLAELNEIINEFQDPTLVSAAISRILSTLITVRDGNANRVTVRVLWLNDDASKNQIITFKTNLGQIVTRIDSERANDGDTIVVREGCGTYSLLEYYWKDGQAIPAQTRLTRVQKPYFRVYDRDQIALDQWQEVNLYKPDRLYSTIAEFVEGTVLDTESGYKLTFLPTQFRSLDPASPAANAFYDIQLKHTLQDTTTYVGSDSSEQIVPGPFSFRRLQSIITEQDQSLNDGLSIGYRRAWFRLRSWANNTYDLSTYTPSPAGKINISIGASSWPTYEWNITFVDGLPTVLHTDNLENVVENLIVAAINENLTLNTLGVDTVELINPDSSAVLETATPINGVVKFTVPNDISAGFYNIRLNGNDDYVLKALIISVKADPRSPKVTLDGMTTDYEFNVTRNGTTHDVIALFVEFSIVTGIAEIRYQGEFTSEDDHATAPPGIEYNSLQDINLGTFGPSRLATGMFKNIRANAVGNTELWPYSVQIPALDGSLMTNISALRATWLAHRNVPSLGEILINRSLSSWRWYRKFTALLDKHYKIYDLENDAPKISVDRLLEELAIGINYSMPDAISGVAFDTRLMNHRQYTGDGTVTEFEINTGAETIYQGVFGPDHVYVYIDGLLLTNDQYSIVGQDVVFATAPVNAAVIDIYHGNTELIYTGIPASPAKLGLSGLFKPRLVRETWGSYERVLLQRHDGSKTVAYQSTWTSDPDPRDTVSLELENRIYNACLYRVGDSQRQLLNRFVINEDLAAPQRSRAILEWASSNNVDYRDRSEFDSSDPWSWNYDGKSWRAIYLENFGTLNLHSAPWEALGYHEKPIWWDSNYSWTDLTKRTNLENALRNGIISEPGEPITYDFRVARTFDTYPVALDGTLVDPVTWGITAPGIDQAAQPWEIGSYGPIEDAWARSPAGAWSRAITTANNLVTAGEFVERNINPYVIPNQNNSPAAIGETTFAPNSFTQFRPTIGIGAVLFESNRELNLLGEQPLTDMTQINPLLQFAVGGFTDQTARFYLYNARYQTGNYIPEEDFAMVLNQSVPVDQLRYSAVRLEKDGTGFRVYGYDPELQYFTVATPVKSNSAGGGGSTQRIINTPTGDYIEWLKWLTTGVDIPYGYLFADKQSLFEFFTGLNAYQANLGLVFDQANTRGGIDDWKQAAIDAFAWVAENWNADSHYVVVSPAGLTGGLKIYHDDGQLDRLDGDLLRKGKVVFANGKFAKNTDLLLTRNYEPNVDFVQSLNDNQIVFAQIALRKYDHVFYFNSRTRFNDIIVDYQTNQRLEYFKTVAKRSRGWTGRMQANGLLPIPRGVLPGFDTLVTDIVQSRVPENAQFNRFIGTLSKSNVVPDKTSVIDEIIADSSIEFQYKQGLQNALGTNLAFDAFFRNRQIDIPGRIQDLNVNEQWLFKTGEFGRLSSRRIWEIELRKKDVVADRQAIRFLEGSTDVDLRSDTIIDLIGKNDSRWISRDSENIDFAGITRSSINKITSLTQGWLPNAGVANLDQTDTKARDLASLSSNANIGQLPVEENPKIRRILEILSFSIFVNYNPEDLVWYEGKLYKCKSPVKGGENTAWDPTQWELYNDEDAVANPPNIWVSDYNFKNEADLPADSDSVGWNVTQLVGPIYIEECCPNALNTGLIESKVTFADPHKLEVGETFLISGSGDGNYDKFHQVKEKVDDYNVLIEARSTSGAIAYNLVMFKLVSTKFGSLSSLQTALPPATSGVVEGTLAYVETEANKEYKVYKLEGGVWTLNEEYTTVNKSMVDSKLINSVKILDATTEDVLATVEVYDPYKGLAIDEVARFINYRDGVDPASYNFNDLGLEDIDTINPWGGEHIGTLWWDSSQVRYIEYEQGPIDYRIKHWGEQFKDSQVVIYEWTRSTEMPTIDSTPDARVDTSNGIGGIRYSKINEEDLVTGAVTTYYYYWSKNANTLPENSTRPYTAMDIQSTIENPDAAGVTWMSPIDTNAFVISNIKSFLSTRDSVIIRIEQNENAEQQHDTGELVSEGFNGDTISEFLYRRLRASATGRDNYRKSYAVRSWAPNTEYNEGEYVINWNYSTLGYVPKDANTDYGPKDIPIIASLDYQRDQVRLFRTPTLVTTDFYDSRLHRVFLVAKTHTSSTIFKDDYLNENLIVSGASALTPDVYAESGYRAVVESKRRVPDSRLHPLRRYGNSYVPVPQTWYKDIREARRNLVYSANSYLLRMAAVNKNHWDAHLLTYQPLFGGYVKDLTPYWEYVDYTADSYQVGSEQLLVIEHTQVQEYEDANGVEITLYGIVDSNGVLQQSFIKDGLDTTLVYQRNGTIQFKDAVWNGALGDSWDTSRWDRYAWDEDNSEVVESILTALREDLFVDDELGYFNLFFFDMVKESLRQIPNVSWLVKTTYLDINQQSKNDLKPVAHYYDRRDILVRDYLNEVKPYHSKISDLNQSLTSREDLTVEIEEFLNLGLSQTEYTALDEVGNELTDENGNTLILPVNDIETTPQDGA